MGLRGGWAPIIVTDRQGKNRKMVLLIRKPRSKWVRMVCFCKRRRKDGTCIYTDGALSVLNREAVPLLHLEHPEIDRQLHLPPGPA